MDQTTNLRHRQAVSSCLAKFLNYPDPELGETLVSGELREAFAPAFAALGLAEAFARLGDFAIAQPEALLLELEKEYTWLFYASKPRAVHLFESVYQSGKLMQEATFAVARLYYEAGLAVGESMQLPPDHIAMELEFLSYLYFQEAKAGEEKIEANRRFAGELRQRLLDAHLNGFAGRFAGRLAEKARHPFYRLTAELLAGFLPER